jgi:hypothetical protein
VRWRLAAAVGLAGLAVLPSAAGAQTAPNLDIRVEVDTSPRTSFSELGVYRRVILTDRSTGQPPVAEYAVYGEAATLDGRERTGAFECEEQIKGNPQAPPRVYYCPLFVDHGGAWTFSAIVNQARTDTKQAPVTVGRVTAPFRLDTKDVYTGDPNTKPVKGKFVEVFALAGHEFAATIWFFCALAMAALVFPPFRRSLSAGALYRLERRLDLIVRLTWATTGVVVVSGLYLMLNQAAYKTPFSRSAIDGVFALPYGRPYFLALAVKVGIYALMVAGSVPLMRGAQRNLRFQALPAPAGDHRTTPGSGGVALAVETRPAPPGPRERLATVPARVATVIVVTGVPAILICVTLLKYFHELVEASRVVSGR